MRIPDKQDVVIKASIILLIAFVVAVMLSEWYYEAAVIVLSGGLCWLFARKAKARRKLVVVVVATLGIASTVGINRLVTHQIVIENRSGGVLPYILVSGWITENYQFTMRVRNLSDGTRQAHSLRSLFFDGELEVEVMRPDRSSFHVKTYGIDEEYRRKSHVIIHDGEEIEILRR